MSKPDLDPKIRELMDACRPGRDDVEESEMTALADLLDRDADAQEVFARSEYLDRSIGEAFRDVQPPPGLAARLLSAVESEEEPKQAATSNDSAESDLTQLEPAEKSSPANQASREHSRPSSRRRWIAVAGTLAASLVVVAYAAIMLNPPPDPVSHFTVADKAIDWIDEAQQGDWESSKNPPTDRYPLASSIVVGDGPRPVDQWQFVGTDYGKAAVYDLTPPGKRFVYLFVIRADEDISAPQLLPTLPARNTQGVCVGVAYHDGVLHVLVVDGDERRYGQFIRDRLPVI
jgi:hypothetical protein